MNKESQLYSQNMTYNDNRYNIIPRSCKQCGMSDRFFEDSKRGEIICTSCGIVSTDRMIHDGPDWSNHESDRESGKDNSRVSWTDPTNPYATLGSTMPNFYIKIKNEKGEWVTRNLKTVHDIVSSNNKERAFYEVIKVFNNLVHTNYFNQRTVDLAKIYWDEFVKTKRIFRGGNRKGILACCLLYASNQTSTTKSREYVADAMMISKDDIVKGEAIFTDIISKTRHKNILELESKVKDMFIPIILDLELPYKYGAQCYNIYRQCEEELSEISSSAAIGGTISYLIHSLKKLKKPTKKQITLSVNITNPTLTNAIKIIKRTLDE